MTIEVALMRSFDDLIEREISEIFGVVCANVLFISKELVPNSSTIFDLSKEKGTYVSSASSYIGGVHRFESVFYLYQKNRTFIKPLKWHQFILVDPFILPVIVFLHIRGVVIHVSSAGPYHKINRAWLYLFEQMSRLRIHEAYN